MSFSKERSTVKDFKNSCFRKTLVSNSSLAWCLKVTSGVCILVCDCVRCWKTPSSLFSHSYQEASHGQSNSPLVIVCLSFSWTQFISFTSAWYLTSESMMSFSHKQEHSSLSIHGHWVQVTMEMLAVINVMTCFVSLAKLLPVWLNKRKRFNGTRSISSSSTVPNSNSCLCQPE